QRPPDRHAGLTGVLGRRHRAPVGGAERDILDAHRRSILPKWPDGSTPPAQGARLDRVDEVAALVARPRIFLLQPVIPFRLGIGIVDEEERRGMAQPALL